MGDIPIRVEEVSADTEQANAYAFGLGPSRRVVFWDTMLLEPFDESEQKVVLAHELAHHSQRHLAEGLGWFALFAIPGAWILMRTTRRRGGMGAPEALPLALLVVAIYQLATAPLANHISRRLEAEADWKALQVTEDPAALEGLMLGFSKTGLGDPDPPGWVQLMVGTHPTLADRIAMARVRRGRPLGERVLGAGAPSGGVRRPPFAVIAPHWTQFDGVISTVTIPSPTSRPTSYTCAGTSTATPPRPGGARSCGA